MNRSPRAQGGSPCGQTQKIRRNFQDQKGSQVPGARCQVSGNLRSVGTLIFTLNRGFPAGGCVWSDYILRVSGCDERPEREKAQTLWEHIWVQISASDQQNPDCGKLDRTDHLALSTKYCKEIKRRWRGNLQMEIRLSNLSSYCNTWSQL